MKKKRTNPEPPAQVAARMKRYRQRKTEADRAFLRSAGWDGTPDAFLAAWKAGRIRVTFEIITDNKKG